MHSAIRDRFLTFAIPEEGETLRLHPAILQLHGFLGRLWRCQCVHERNYCQRLCVYVFYWLGKFAFGLVSVQCPDTFLNWQYESFSNPFFIGLSPLVRLQALPSSLLSLEVIPKFDALHLPPSLWSRIITI